MHQGFFDQAVEIDTSEATDAGRGPRFSGVSRCLGSSCKADEARRSSRVDARSGEFALWGWVGPDRRREQRVGIPEPD